MLLAVVLRRFPCEYHSNITLTRFRWSRWASKITSCTALWNIPSEFLIATEWTIVHLSVQLNSEINSTRNKVSSSSRQKCFNNTYTPKFRFFFPVPLYILFEINRGCSPDMTLYRKKSFGSHLKFAHVSGYYKKCQLVYRNKIIILQHGH